MDSTLRQVLNELYAAFNEIARLRQIEADLTAQLAAKDAPPAQEAMEPQETDKASLA